MQRLQKSTQKTSPAASTRSREYVCSHLSVSKEKESSLGIVGMDSSLELAAQSTQMQAFKLILCQINLILRWS